MLRKMSLDEEPDLKALKLLVRECEHVVDIGANMGVYAKYLSEFVGEGGFVYSIEPIPSTFALLSSNIRKLGLKNVEAMNCAVSDVSRMVTMEIPRYKTGGENFYMAHIVDKKAGGPAVDERDPPAAVAEYRVQTETVDRLFAGSSERIAFIKVDVEGAELDVLRGSTEVLDKFKPAWLIEISDSPDRENSKAARLFRLLADRGYRAFWFDGDSLHERRTGDREINYFFLTEEFVARASERGVLSRPPASDRNGDTSTPPPREGRSS